MPRWTLPIRQSERFRFHINSGSRDLYLDFDYALVPLLPGSDVVEIMLASNVPPAAAAWFEPLKSGMLQGIAEMKLEGHELVGVRIEVTKILFHDADTSARGCKYRGRRFIECLKNSLVPAP